MAEIEKTNICCLDLNNECIAYFKSLGLNVFEGTLGSVMSIDWNKIKNYRVFIRPDFDIPSNLHEYHVYVADTGNAKQREFKSEEHESKKIEKSDPRRFSCEPPVNLLDIQPLGGYYLNRQLQAENRHKRIEIVFLGPNIEVEYTTDSLTYHDPRSFGKMSNNEAWGILKGNSKYGRRVKQEDYALSKLLFEGRKDHIEYYNTFQFPATREGDTKIPDPDYMSLLNNEDGECISYLFFDKEQGLKIVLPQVEDKAGLLRDLFENLIFKHFSDFFPDIEVKSWIKKPDYQLPEEKAIRSLMATKQEEFEKEMADLGKKAEEASNRYAFLKKIITCTGSELVVAIKEYLEWLGFENIIDQDDALKEGEIREEDLNMKYKGQLVLIEVKGINGTSKDTECSQVDKIVLRRTKQLKTSDIHGVYIVNNQKNVELAGRQVPPFNDNQVSDAENQDRTMIYTAQLFALFFDIENGYISREEARECFLTPGLANFHNRYKTLGTPYNYYQGNTVICLELNGDKVAEDGELYYEDSLQRLIELKVLSIQQNNISVSTAETGKTAIKVNQKVPKGIDILVC